MRTPLALISALAYAIGLDRQPDTAQANSGPHAADPWPEPWRSPGIPDEPDPIAECILTLFKPAIGASLPLSEALDAMDAWMILRGRQPPSRTTSARRLRAYLTVRRVKDGYVIDGFKLHGHAKPKAAPPLTVTLRDDVSRPVKQAARALDQLRPTTPALRSIPALRARVQADAGLLCAELLNTLQAAREVLDPITDEPGQLGDVVRIATGMLDDALADAAAAPAL